MKRWPVIRHIRYLYATWRLNRWFAREGSKYWLIPNPQDLEHLKRIWRGEA